MLSTYTEVGFSGAEHVPNFGPQVVALVLYEVLKIAVRTLLVVGLIRWTR